MKKIILIKVGGSCFTDKSQPYSLKKGVLKNIAKELKFAKLPMIIAHGAGSFGHPSAKKYLVDSKKVTPYGLAISYYDNLTIHKIFMDALIATKNPAIAFHPSSSMIAKKGKVTKVIFEGLISFIEQNCIPVLRGDILADVVKKYTIISGEEVLFEVGRFLVLRGYKIEKVIFLGSTNGILDKENKTVPTLSKNDIQKIHYKKSDNIDVTGGMKHKIDISLKIAKELNTKVILINGEKKGELKKVLDEKKSAFITNIF